MSNDTKYNGWTNYETWVVSLWLDNDEGSQTLTQEAAHYALDCAKADHLFTRKERATLDLADALKNLHEDNTPTITGVYADLINAALGSVNWHELAEHYMAEVEEEADDTAL